MGGVTAHISHPLDPNAAHTMALINAADVRIVNTLYFLDNAYYTNVVDEAYVAMWEAYHCACVRVYEARRTRIGAARVAFTGAVLTRLRRVYARVARGTPATEALWRLRVAQANRDRVEYECLSAYMRLLSLGEWKSTSDVPLTIDGFSRMPLYVRTVRRERALRTTAFIEAAMRADAACA